MAAYRQILQNHAATGRAASDDPALHQALVEKVIMGADVVQSAIHLTAATLAAMSPSMRFEQMQLHTLRLGMESSGDIHLGSLDWLASTEVQSFFSATQEQIGATSSAGSVVQRPRADRLTPESYDSRVVVAQPDLEEALEFLAQVDTNSLVGFQFDAPA